MACTPFLVGVGFFIDSSSTSWSAAPSTSMGGKSVALNQGGANPGITVSMGGKTPLFHQQLAGHVLRYMFFGTDNNVVILDSESGPGPIQRWVSVVDFTGSTITEKNILAGLSSSTAVPAPNVQFSVGTGSAVFVFNSTGTDIQNLGIYRSDNGVILCPGPPPFAPTLEVSGEATATLLQIKHGITVIASKLLPSGNCKVDPPSPMIFPDAVIGGSPSTTTKQFTIRNTGDDCLTINSIGNVAPFSVVSTSIPIPASLLAGQSLTVTVRFAPGAVGMFGPTSLPLGLTPAKGDNALVCKGKGRAPILKIGFSSTSLGFGSLPLGSSRTLALQIKNVGEAGLNVSLAASPPGSVFQWAAFNGVIPFGGTQPLPITFTPTAEGLTSDTISISSADPSSPSAISLSGSGCLANAVIVVPPVVQISFGLVQRGFRSVRFITIKNSGDGLLTFTARIAGVDAALYGLQQDSGSVTDVLATRNFAVDPVSACGPLSTGTGEIIVAVAFFANDVPRLTSAQLIIENSNATNLPGGTSVSLNLAAEIIASIAVDAGLVLDRSGSMADIVGVRTKTAAAVSGGRLFAELIRPDNDDRLTVVKFDDVPEVLEAITLVTSANQPAILNEINGTELAPRGGTSIAGGVMLCLKQLSVARATIPPALNKMMVVLTDGMDNTPYLNPDDNQWYSVMGGSALRQLAPFLPRLVIDTKPIPRPADIKIFSIGLGKEEDIDRGQLSLLSEGSGAEYVVVGDLVGQSFFELEKFFTQVYMNIVGTSPVVDPVFTIAPGEEQRMEFNVLRGDVGALIVIYDRGDQRLPFYLLSPLGESIEVTHVPPGFQLRSGISDTARFMEFLMPVAEPDRYAGRWQVVITHPGEICFGDSRQDPARKWGFISSKCRPTKSPSDYGISIGVGSNFRMQPYVTPGIVRIGDPILLTAVITEAGLPITGCTVTVRAASPGGAFFDLTLADDGVHLDGDANDGEYAREFTRTAEGGSYQFTFRAEGTSRDGEPVFREAVLAKYVEGRVTIEPEPVPPGGADRCCRLLQILLWIIVLLLVLIIFILIFRR